MAGGPRSGRFTKLYDGNNDAADGRDYSNDLANG